MNDSEMMKWFVRDEIKVMGTGDQHVGERQSEVYSRDAHCSAKSG